MKLACVKILLLGHQGFTDGFPSLVIPHNAWWWLNIRRDLFSLFIFPLLFQRTIPFRKKNKIFVLYYLSGLVVVSFCVPEESSDVFSLGWSMIHVGCCSPQRDVVDGHHAGVRGWSPQELQPHLSFPSSCQTKGGPNPHPLSAHLIRKTFPGTWAQNKPSSDSSSETWEGKAGGDMQGLVTGDSSGILPLYVHKNCNSVES